MADQVPQAPATAEFLARAQEGMGSRFQSQASIDESNNRKEQQWKEAYARLGQEPPKVAEFAHDGLTLFERLEMNKRLNTEEWDDKMKLANQYRGINAYEKRFLDERYAEKMAAQKLIDDEVNNELLAYRQAKRAGGVDPESGLSTDASTPSTSSPAPAARKPLPTKPKKDVKSLLKGVVVKKKPKAASNPSAAAGGKIGPTAAEVRATEKVGAAGMTALGKRLVQEDEEPEGESDQGDKRARVDL